MLYGLWDHSIVALHSSTLFTPCHISLQLLSSICSMCPHQSITLLYNKGAQIFQNSRHQKGDRKHVSCEEHTNTKRHCTNHSPRILAPLRYIHQTMLLLHYDSLYFIVFRIITHIHFNDSLISQITEMFTTYENI